MNLQCMRNNRVCDNLVLRVTWQKWFTGDAVQWCKGKFIQSMQARRLCVKGVKQSSQVRRTMMTI